MTALHADNLACSEVISARSIYVEKNKYGPFIRWDHLSTSSRLTAVVEPKKSTSSKRASDD